MARPNVYSIASNVSFADALASGIMSEQGQRPEILSEITILLPTRRSCRTVRDAFLRISDGKPLLLPRLIPVGDLDEDEIALAGWHSGFGDPHIKPAISSLRRQLLLTKLVIAQDGATTSADQAARLSRELASLLDQVHTEGLNFQDLHTLVPEEYADHWNITLDFLKILSQAWPSILEAEGAMDPAARRNALIDAQIRIWQENPPESPVIVAGISNNIPAVSRLMKCVQNLENGIVILPGLDRYLSEDDWENIDVAHPQFALSQIIDDLKLTLEDIQNWDTGNCEASHPLRAKLLSEAMLPAKSTDKWRELDEPVRGILTDVERIDCPTPFEEACVIALVLRRALAQPGQTAALVTPDRNLARRVAGELSRWNIQIDDSAGIPFHLSTVGTFLRLILKAIESQFAPIEFLALCKHPLCRVGNSAQSFKYKVRKFELICLRGPRPAPGIAGLKSALKAVEKRWRKRTGRLNASQKEILSELNEFLEQFETALNPVAKLYGRKKVDLNKLIEGHIRSAQNLCQSDSENGSDRLWVGDDGEVGADFISELLQASNGLGEEDPKSFGGLFESLMQGVAVRPKFGQHPRLAILGLMEARLHRADLVVMGGLNEGIWPPQTTASPWMSRPMMRDFGLHQPEYRIGQAAHDFCQNFGAPKVVLTRSIRMDGTPSVRARWLRRLENRLEHTDIENRLEAKENWLGWAMALDHASKVKPCVQPAPKPPLSSRPRGLYVTDIERWMRDPYSIYARHILNVHKLDPLDADPGAAEYGTIIHEILEKFVQNYPDQLPENSENLLLALGQDIFGSDMDNPGIWAFWWPKFERIASWFIEVETQRRQDIQNIHCEVKGHLDLSGPEGPFTISAKADRLDIHADQDVTIIDYKTGAPPSSREVEAGFAPQLPLEAAIALKGGFREIGSRPIKALEFWRLKGSNPAGEVKSATKEDPQELAENALEGLKGLIGAFDRPETPYRSRPNPENAPKYSDYEHLARVREWSTQGSGGEDE